MLDKRRFSDGVQLRGPKVAGFALLAAGLACFPLSAFAQQAGQKTFSSAADAVRIFIDALQKNDQTALLGILGQDAKDILSSGDAVADKDDREQFVQKYREMHRLVTEPNGNTTLYIGSENLPTPIPIAHKGKAWYFDTPAGKKEIIMRRIGENELIVIQACRELVDAQRKYYAQPHDGGSGKQYAQKLFSDPNKHNGLYWKSRSGEPESPIGPLLASAAIDDAPKDQSWKPEPFQGYYFRLLRGRAASSNGKTSGAGAGGKSASEFVFLAYPAEYESSGVMTFVVEQDGVVYQKDLGDQTAQTAKSLALYVRDATWSRLDQ